MLDHHDAVAFGDKALEDFQQDRHIVDVKSRCRLVEDEEGSPGFAPREPRRKFQALRFPAAQDVEGLAYLQIVEADVCKKLERAADGVGFRSLLKEGDRFRCGHFQDVMDRLAPVVDGEDTLLVAAPFAFRAAEEEVAEELHLDLFESQARAAVAPPLSRIEGKGGRAHACGDRLILHSEEFPDGIEDPEVDGRCGARGA